LLDHTLTDNKKSGVGAIRQYHAKSFELILSFESRSDVRAITPVNAVFQPHLHLPCPEQILGSVTHEDDSLGTGRIRGDITDDWLSILLEIFPQSGLIQPLLHFFQHILKGR